MSTSTNPVIEAALKRALFTYGYFNQDKVWFPDGKPRVQITDMDPEWRHNCVRFLERRAHIYAVTYGLGEIEALSQPVFREVLGENETGVVYANRPPLSQFDLMGDHTMDAFDRWTDARHEDPVEWMKTTPLYRALAAGLPTEGAELDGLAARAAHWSTCPGRTGAGNCRCDEIRAQHQHEREFAVGCPEWTDD